MTYKRNLVVTDAGVTPVSLPPPEPSTEGGGGGPAAPLTITDITAAALRALRLAGNLVPGAPYRVTDYRAWQFDYNSSSQTVKPQVRIHNTELDTTDAGFLAALNALPTEPLLVQALSPSRLHPVALSELYPTDHIEYNVAYQLCGGEDYVSYLYGTVTDNGNGTFTIPNPVDDYYYDQSRYDQWEITMAENPASTWLVGYSHPASEWIDHIYPLVSVDRVNHTLTCLGTPFQDGLNYVEFDVIFNDPGAFHAGIITSRTDGMSGFRANFDFRNYTFRRHLITVRGDYQSYNGQYGIRQAWVGTFKDSVWSDTSASGLAPATQNGSTLPIIDQTNIKYLTAVSSPQNSYGSELVLVSATNGAEFYAVSKWGATFGNLYNTYVICSVGEQYETAAYGSLADSGRLNISTLHSLAYTVEKLKIPVISGCVFAGTFTRVGAPGMVNTNVYGTMQDVTCAYSFDNNKIPSSWTLQNMNFLAPFTYQSCSGTGKTVLVKSQDIHLLPGETQIQLGYNYYLQMSLFNDGSTLSRVKTFVPVSQLGLSPATGTVLRLPYDYQDNVDAYLFANDTTARTISGILLVSGTVGYGYVETISLQLDKGNTGGVTIVGTPAGNWINNSFIMPYASIQLTANGERAEFRKERRRHPTNGQYYDLNVLTNFVSGYL